MRGNEGLLAIWNDVSVGGETAYRAWHSGEHLRERLSVAGFLRGRRLYSPDARPRWLTLYETASPDVLRSAAYLARLEAPSDWTRRTLPLFTGTARMACRVVDAVGLGRGGQVLSLRSASSPDEALPALREVIAAAQAAGSAFAACIAVAESAAPQNTAERQLRRNEAEPPRIAAFLELPAGVGRGDIALPALVSDADLYLLEHEVTPDDCGIPGRAE